MLRTVAVGAHGVIPRSMIEFPKVGGAAFRTPCAIIFVWCVCVSGVLRRRCLALLCCLADAYPWFCTTSRLLGRSFCIRGFY